jgi:hypothetical protein
VGWVLAFPFHYARMLVLYRKEMETGFVRLLSWSVMRHEEMWFSD